MFVLCFLQYIFFISNISINPFFGYKDNYFKWVIQKKLKVYVNKRFGLGNRTLYLFFYIYNKYSLKEIE